MIVRWVLRIAVALLIILVLLPGQSKDPDLEADIRANEPWVKSLLGIQERRYQDSMASIRDSLAAAGELVAIDSARADSLEDLADSLKRGRETLVQLLPDQVPAVCIPWATALDAAIHETDARQSECRQKSKVIKGQRHQVALAIAGMKLAIGRVDTLTPALQRTRDLLKRSEDARLSSRRLHLGLFSIPRPPRWISGPLGCLLGGYLNRSKDGDMKDELQGCTAGGWAGDYVGR